MHRPRPLRYLPMAGVVVALGLPPVAAQDGDDPVDRGPERCISLNRLDRTEVIDDRTIIFHMRGGGLFLNHLSRECPGLKREERFMYSPTSNRLCDVDTVTVIERWGFGLTRGFTCALGMFHPISDVELAELRQLEEDDGKGRRRGEGEGDFEVVPVDPPADDEEVAADDGDAADDEAKPAGDDPESASDD